MSDNSLQNTHTAAQVETRRCPSCGRKFTWSHRAETFYCKACGWGHQALVEERRRRLEGGKICPRCGHYGHVKWSARATCWYCTDCQWQRDKIREAEAKLAEGKPTCPNCGKRSHLYYSVTIQAFYCRDCGYNCQELAAARAPRFALIPLAEDTTPAPIAAAVRGDFESGSANTARAYDADLRHFARWLGVKSVAEAFNQLVTGGPGRANVALLAYRAAMRQEGLSVRTRNRHHAAVKGLIRRARILELIQWTVDIRYEKSETRRRSRRLTNEEFHQMLAAAADDVGFFARRNVAALRLLRDLGLRISELTEIKLADVHLTVTAPYLTVIGKGRSERETLALPEPTAGTLREWLTARGMQPGPVFVSRHSFEQMPSRSWYQIIRRIGIRAGVSSVHPHAIRHLSITQALALTSGDLSKVQRYARHAHVATTLLYDDRGAELGAEVAARVAQT